jgi:hypothetical protein
MILSLFKVTNWEKNSIGRRLLCAFGRVLILFGIVAAISFIVYANRNSIAAKVWHWRHGYAANIGAYDIPVPGDWLVLAESSTDLTLANISAVRRQRDGEFHAGTIISADVSSYQLQEFTTRPGWRESWVLSERQRLASEKAEAVEEQTIKFADESVICVGGKQLAAIVRDMPNLPQFDTISLNCMSERGLSIQFFGEPSDVLPFYTFVSQIQRRS